MEFKQAYMDEWPNEGLVARHQREIAPLLAKRYIFAGSSDFTMYDFWNGYGHVNENVFAYSNRFGDERSLVIYNNKYDSARGTIHISAAFMDKGSGSLRQRSLSDGLGLPTGESIVIACRDTHGLEYLRRATEIHWRGLSFDLRGFQCIVLLDWRALQPNAEWPWDRLCDSLGGRGVHSIHDEMVRLRLRPLHEALRAAISPSNVSAFGEVAAEIAHRTFKQGSAVHPLPSVKTGTDSRLRALADKCQLFFDRLLEQIPEENRSPGASSIPRTSRNVWETTSHYPDPTYAESLRDLLIAGARLQALAQSFSTDWPAQSRPILPCNAPAARTERTWAPILACIVLRSIPEHCAPNGDRVELFDRLLFRHALADLFCSMGMEGEASWQAAAQVRLLLSPCAVAPDAVRGEELWAAPDVRWLAGVNLAAGVTYFNKQQFEELLTWLQLPILIEIAHSEALQARSEPTGGIAADIAAIEASVAAARKAAQRAGYDLSKYLASTSTAKITP